MREAIIQVFQNLRAHKLRSFLTMFGILWGVISVVVLSATGEGFQRGNQQVLEELGRNVAIVWGGRTSLQAGGERAGRAVFLTLGDARALQRESSLIRVVSPEIQRYGISVKSLYNAAALAVHGIEPQYQEIRTIEIERGRGFRFSDDEQSLRVAVIGADATRQLFGTRDSIPWMPKARYDVMHQYMPTVGTRGLDMMQRTATVQANLDFADEADAAAKMRCIYSVTPMLTSLWAASPIVDEQATDFQSYRAWIWRDVDHARAGLVPFVFDRDDAFHAYTQWALDVPLYFIYRGGYKPVPSGLTFRQFLNSGHDGMRATMADWALHLSTLFPEGRLKKFIEVRGCDCGSLPMIEALAPMMRGLLYDKTARDAAIALTASLSFADRQRIADEIPVRGFATQAGAHTIGELAKQLVAIARDGLSRVAPASVGVLAPVEEIAATGRTQADRIRELWNRHAGDRAALVKALAHPGLA